MAKQDKRSLEDIFRFFDKNKSGAVDKFELIAGLRILGCNPTENEIQAMIRDADSKVNPNGKLEFNEFCHLLSIHRKTFDDERLELIKAFQTFDKNGDGVIDKAELRKGLTQLGYSKLTDEEVNELFDAADTDHSGTIDFNELVNVIMPKD